MLSPIKRSELIDKAVAQKTAILVQIRHATASEPRYADLASATAQDVAINEYEMQGISRVTMLVRVKDHDFILSFDPSKQHTQRGAAVPAVRAFQDHLHNNGVPTQRMLGEAFYLPTMPSNRCELSEFTNGMQVAKASDLNESELASMATTIAAMHRLGGFRPPGAPKPLTFLGARMPHGFVHGDLNLGNFIFDPAGGKVSCVIDFERARYDYFVNDLARFLREFLTVEKEGDKVTGRFDGEKAKHFLDLYCAARPISMDEANQLNRRMEGEAAAALERYSTLHGAPAEPHVRKQAAEALVEVIHESFDACASVKGRGING